MSTAVSGEAEHTSSARAQHVARHQAARDGGLGRERSTRGELAALRGESSGHYYVRQVSTPEPDPTENCHLTVKKLPKN